MKPKLIIIFLLIVLIPLAGLLWLGVRVARNEQEIVRHQMRELLTGMLKDTNVVIAKLLDERLPKVHTPELFEHMTAVVFQQVYDAYFGARRSVYAASHGERGSDVQLYSVSNLDTFTIKPH